MLYQDEKCIYSAVIVMTRNGILNSEHVFGSEEESIILFIYFLLNVLG